MLLWRSPQLENYVFLSFLLFIYFFQTVVTIRYMIQCTQVSHEISLYLRIDDKTFLSGTYINYQVRAWHKSYLQGSISWFFMGFKDQESWKTYLFLDIFVGGRSGVVICLPLVFLKNRNEESCWWQKSSHIIQNVL